MKYQQNAVLTSLRRAQQFFDANSGAVGSLNPTARKELDDVVAQLASLAVVQDGGARGSKGETARLRTLRAELRNDHMAPIAEVAKYKLQAVPEFAALMLPPSTVSGEAEVASATSMAAAAAPHAQTFTDSGLSPTFVEDLRAAVAVVSDSMVDRDNHQTRRNGATSGLAATERRGRAMLRVLNRLILAKVGANAQLRREWTTAKAVRGKPGPAAGAVQDHGVTPVHLTATVGTPTSAPPPTLVATPPSVVAAA